MSHQRDTFLQDRLSGHSLLSHLAAQKTQKAKADGQEGKQGSVHTQTFSPTQGWRYRKNIENMSKSQ